MPGAVHTKGPLPLPKIWLLLLKQSQREIRLNGACSALQPVATFACCLSNFAAMLSFGQMSNMRLAASQAAVHSLPTCCQLGRVADFSCSHALLQLPYPHDRPPPTLQAPE